MAATPITGRDIARRRRTRNAVVDRADVSVSGGVGLANGYCVMAGGERRRDIQRLETVAGSAGAIADAGIVHAGAVGFAGHYAKMVHNGIEYGMMRALAEGFA